jgi:hypothetical protein
MSFNLIRVIAGTENNDDIHLGRLLLLLLAANEKGSKSIDGITKLAKLDFLLRYPNCLERALEAENKGAELANVKDYERSTLESKMIRFKYGPWDSRYRRWLNLLTSRDLATIEIQKKTVVIKLTEKGRKIAELFSADASYTDIYFRSQLVIKTFGKMSSSGIKNFVYQVFPELETMKWGEDILL